MTVILTAERDHPATKLLLSSSAGVAALMHAFTYIGLTADASRELVAAVQGPQPQLAPTAEELVALTAAPFAAPAAAGADASGRNTSVEPATPGQDGEASAAMQAALRAAAATNSNHQSTIALMVAAAAANESRPKDGGLDFDDPWAAERAQERAAAERAAARAAEFVRAAAAAKNAARAEAKADAGAAGGLKAPALGGATGMDMLRALMEDKSKKEAKEAAEAVAKPIAGYARASMFGRAAEKLQPTPPSQDAKSEAVTSFSKPLLNFKFSQSAPAREKAEAEVETNVFLGGIPRGTSEALILVECKKYGRVSSIFYQADAGQLLEGGWALIAFQTCEEAEVAVRRLCQRVALFGAAQPLEVRLGEAGDDQRALQAREEAARALELPTPAGDGPWPFTMREEPRRLSGRSRGREAAAARLAARRSRSRSRRRRRERRKGSASVSDEEAPRADPAKPREPRGLSGFDAAPGQPGDAKSDRAPAGGRQVGVRGAWAEFSTAAGKPYFVNVVSGEKTWTRPAGYDTMRSGMKPGGSLGPGPGGALIAPGGPQTGHSNVYVGSLPNGTNEATFRHLFSPFGTVVTCKVVPEMHYGFVKFSSPLEAQLAIDTVTGAIFNGSPLVIRFANKDCY